MYCYIDSFNEVHCVSDDMDQCDDMSFECSNYFNDEDFAKQVALHQRLYRKLLKFAYDNEAEDTLEWDAKNIHYGIFYDCAYHKFVLEFAQFYKSDVVYFSSQEVAERALKDVVEPFMKEHPDFVW